MKKLFFVIMISVIISSCAQNPVKTDPVKAPGSVNDTGEANKRIVTAMLRRFEQMNFPEWEKLWAVDGILELPFAPVGFPQELHGNGSLFLFSKNFSKYFKSITVKVNRLDTLNDPDWVIVEYQERIKLNDGSEYNNRYLDLAHVKDGVIASVREYFDPTILQRAFGKNLQKVFNLSELRGAAGTQFR